MASRNVDCINGEPVVREKRDISWDEILSFSASMLQDHSRTNLRRLMGDSPLLPVVSADPIAPTGLRPRFPATHPVWDIFADLLGVTARNDTDGTDDTDNTNSASDMDDTDDTDTWASYRCESTAMSSDKFS